MLSPHTTAFCGVQVPHLTVIRAFDPGVDKKAGERVGAVMAPTQVTAAGKARPQRVFEVFSRI